MIKQLEVFTKVEERGVDAEIITKCANDLAKALDLVRSTNPPGFTVCQASL